MWERLESDGFSSIFVGSFLSCFLNVSVFTGAGPASECSRVECHINKLPIEMLSPDHCPSELLHATCSVIHLGTDLTPQEEFTPADGFALSRQKEPAVCEPSPPTVTSPRQDLYMRQISHYHFIWGRKDLKKKKPLLGKWYFWWKDQEKLFFFFFGKVTEEQIVP